MKLVNIRNLSPPITTVHVKYCDSFWSKFVGLMFRKELKHDEGIILVENRESKINTSIHMFFMNFDITVLWLDKDLIIVDKALARKGVPIYKPTMSAQYVLELHHSKFSDYSIGDQLVFGSAI